MNVTDETCQSQIECSIPLCNWSCQVIGLLSNVNLVIQFLPNISISIQSESKSLWQFSHKFHTFWFYFLIVQTRCGNRMMLVNRLVCVVPMAFNTLLSTSYSKLWCFLGFFSSVLTPPGGLLCGHLAEYTPHTVAEGAVRRVKEGTSAVLVQSGLQESWWAEAMGSCCYLRNVQDLAADGQTPCERRFNSQFDGPTIPFGAEVNFYSKSAIKRLRSSASVRHKRLSWENHKQVESINCLAKSASWNNPSLQSIA